MRLVRLFYVASFMLFASMAYADPALVIQEEGCILPDGDGNVYFIADCSYQFVFTDGDGDSPFLSRKLLFKWYTILEHSTIKLSLG